MEQHLRFLLIVMTKIGKRVMRREGTLALLMLMMPQWSLPATLISPGSSNSTQQHSSPATCSECQTDEKGRQQDNQGAFYQQSRCFLPTRTI